MANQRTKLNAIKLAPKYHLIADNKRMTPCTHIVKGQRVPCGTRVRVKIIEPGPQSGTCPSCGVVSWFILSVTDKTIMGGPGGDTPLAVLRMRWVNEKEAADWTAASFNDVCDVDLSHLTGDRGGVQIISSR